mmetsp:Transcript_13957/g.50141  ORF Transcript_13957/g.50141 Transcript_13957/m.50141 type:complete len:490 (-) Transcript_13957:175-1644(-)
MIGVLSSASPTNPTSSGFQSGFPSASSKLFASSSMTTARDAFSLSKLISVMSPEIVPRPMEMSCFRPLKSIPEPSPSASSASSSSSSSSAAASSVFLDSLPKPNARDRTLEPRGATRATPREEEEEDDEEALSAAARRGVFARLARAVARRPASRLRPRGGGGGGASRKLLGSGSGDCKSVVDRAYTSGTIKLNLAVVNDAARIALIGSVSSTNDDSVTVVNMAQALYDILSDIKPTIVLTGQYDFSTDPYSYDTNNPSLIESFNAWQRANEASLTTHNVAHLFTGYDIGVHQGQSSVAGRAYLGVVCNSAYNSAVNEVKSPPHTLSSMIVAHEMGHNFGFGHDGDGGNGESCTASDTVMGPSGCTYAGCVWSDCSKETYDCSAYGSGDYDYSCLDVTLGLNWITIAITIAAVMAFIGLAVLAFIGWRVWRKRRKGRVGPTAARGGAPRKRNKYLAAIAAPFKKMKAKFAGWRARRAKKKNAKVRPRGP